MYLLKFDPEARTLNEVPAGEFDADPSCRYFHVQAKRVEVPIITENGYIELVWQHPDWQAPQPITLKRRPWIKRLLMVPKLTKQHVRLGLPFLPALRLALLVVSPRTTTSARGFRSD
jgi:hypothetical protein